MRKLADLKLRIEDRIKTLEEELDMLKQAAQLIDSVLKKSSFMPASQVPPFGEEKEGEEARARTLRRSRDGLPLTNARFFGDRVEIEVNPELPLRTSVPPFKTFFINRILESMKEKDEREAGEGRMPPSQVLGYRVEEDENGKLTRIEVWNTRDERRVNEILNTLTWTLTKMLEKVEGSTM